jgi:hypothetical protein
MENNNSNVKCNVSPPYTWRLYTDILDFSQYVDIEQVVGIKHPDPISGGVTLRLSNGDFVSIKEDLRTVLIDLAVVLEGLEFDVLNPPENIKPPIAWRVFTDASDGYQEYIDIEQVVGVKYPDPVNSAVTLRISNGHFVSVKESLGDVLVALVNVMT